jgi:hypothetical protein
MALDYSPTLDRHDVRRKVGVITRAELVGRKLELGGYLFARDFPEIVQEIAKSARAEMASADPEEISKGRAVQRGSGRSWGQRGSQQASGWKSSLAAAAAQLLSLTTAIRASSKHLQDVRRESDHLTLAARGMTAGSPLGMSYEVTDVLLADSRARVWTLTKVTFTGAAILRQAKKEDIIAEDAENGRRDRGAVQ